MEMEPIVKEIMWLMSTTSTEFAQILHHWNEEANALSKSGVSKMLLFIGNSLNLSLSFPLL